MIKMHKTNKTKIGGIKMNIEVDFNEENFMRAMESYKNLSVKENDTVTIVYKAKDIHVKAQVDKVDGDTIALKPTQ